MNKVVIGTGEDCDLVVRDDYASKRHAAIEHIPGFYVIYDLGSTNGTFIRRRGRDVRVPLGERRILTVGDVVVVGRTAIPWKLQ